MARNTDVLQGTLDLLILKALSVSPMHGWGIGDRISELSHDAFKIGQGSLYPALRRLEQRNLVMSAWQQTENHRVARYYELTANGTRALADEIDSWRFYAGAINRVIGA